MKLTNNTRAALIGTLNSIALSDWLCLPIDASGCDYIFVRRQAARLFGKPIRTADLFSLEGNASRLATEIIWVASVHGWVAHSVGHTYCPHMLEAFEAMAF